MNTSSSKKNSGPTLGDRMKLYEKASERYMTRRIPLCLRFDGVSFHTWARGLQKPFDDSLRRCMTYAAYRVCDAISGARFAYTQSDEISVMVIDYQSTNTEPWFGYRQHKIESVAASMCTAYFNMAAIKWLPDHVVKKGPACFDARAFSMPVEDVTNLFIWRQRDCTKNSVSSLAQAHFSHRDLHGKNSSDMQDMLMLQKKINWNDVETRFKRGTAVYKVRVVSKNPVDPEKPDVVRSKWVADYEMPQISKDTDYVFRWLEPTTVVEGVPSGCEVCQDIGFKNIHAT